MLRTRLCPKLILHKFILCLTVKGVQDQVSQKEIYILHLHSDIPIAFNVLKALRTFVADNPF